LAIVSPKVKVESNGQDRSFSYFRDLNTLLPDSAGVAAVSSFFTPTTLRPAALAIPCILLIIPFLAGAFFVIIVVQVLVADVVLESLAILLFSGRMLVVGTAPRLLRGAAAGAAVVFVVVVFGLAIRGFSGGGIADVAAGY